MCRRREMPARTLLRPRGTHWAVHATPKLISARRTFSRSFWRSKYCLAITASEGLRALLVGVHLGRLFTMAPALRECAAARLLTILNTRSSRPLQCGADYPPERSHCGSLQRGAIRGILVKITSNGLSRNVQKPRFPDRECA
jgi:hypothetical protein